MPVASQPIPTKIQEYKTMKTKSPIHRNARGTMLVVACVSAALLGIASITGLSFAGIYMAETLLQNVANTAALGGASLMNGGDPQQQAAGTNTSDPIGQMNNMIARSRVAVYESRQNLDNVANSNLGNLQNLSQQLSDTARDGAKSMENERQVLKEAVEEQATTAIKNQIAQYNQFRLVLPWIQIGTPRLVVTGSPIEFGQLTSIQSNVSSMDPSTAVNAYDAVQNYVDTNNHYKANTRLMLPGNDADLTFLLSSLQPPMQHEVSQSRLVLPSAFKALPNGNGQTGDIPSTVKVTLEMNIETQLACHTSNDIRVTSLATTFGGADMR